MNCLTDAAQENPNDRRALSSRDSLTVQITCRWNLAFRDCLRADDHAVDRQDHSDPLGGRAARPRGSGVHSELHRLGQGDPARTLDGPHGED